jgi:hypothetical protein
VLFSEQLKHYGGNGPSYQHQSSVDQATAASPIKLVLRHSYGNVQV